MKKLTTKEKIKQAAIKLFNQEDTLTVTTNHICKELGMSPGNLYYHYKNKEEIVLDIYKEMSIEFTSFDGYSRIKSSKNPLKELLFMYQKYGELFWKYRFLMRDSAVLMRVYPSLKEQFIHNQNMRIVQIEALLKFLIEERILERIPEKELRMRAKLNWFVATYWQIFAQTQGELSKESISESLEVIFWLQIYPYLSEKGKELLKG